VSASEYVGAVLRILPAHRVGSRAGIVHTFSLAEHDRRVEHAVMPRRKKPDMSEVGGRALPELSERTYSQPFDFSAGWIAENLGVNLLDLINRQEFGPCYRLFALALKLQRGNPTAVKLLIKQAEECLGFLDRN
jgi:hypothetical protein